MRSFSYLEPKSGCRRGLFREASDGRWQPCAIQACARQRIHLANASALWMILAGGAATLKEWKPRSVRRAIVSWYHKCVQSRLVCIQSATDLIIIFSLVSRHVYLWYVESHLLSRVLDALYRLRRKTCPW